MGEMERIGKEREEGGPLGGGGSNLEGGEQKGRGAKEGTRH